MAAAIAGPIACEVYAAACADGEWLPSLPMYARSLEVKAAGGGDVERKQKPKKSAAAKSRSWW